MASAPPSLAGVRKKPDSVMFWSETEMAVLVDGSSPVWSVREDAPAEEGGKEVKYGAAEESGTVVGDKELGNL